MEKNVEASVPAHYTRRIMRYTLSGRGSSTHPSYTLPTHSPHTHAHTHAQLESLQSDLSKLENRVMRFSVGLLGTTTLVGLGVARLVA